MWLKPRHFFLLAPLLLVTAVQAAPGKGSGVSAPAPKPNSPSAHPQAHGSANAKDYPRSGSRYGVGYEARHGINAETRSDRVDRMERPDRPERVERPERIERDDRGR